MRVRKGQHFARPLIPPTRLTGEGKEMIPEPPSLCHDRAGDHVWTGNGTNIVLYRGQIVGEK